MTPRPNIVAIDADAPLEELRQLVINEQYSRVPVFEATIDRIIGFIHVRDMFELDEDARKTRQVRELVRPVRFVPETKPVNDLVKEMQCDRAHMAVVVDEYGNTAGLVTLEDLVEEVFGEIRDEHEPAVDVTEEPEGRYVVSGNFGVDRLEELLHFRPVEEPESTTVGGLVTEWLGRVPQPGETVQQQGIKIEVLASNDLRVKQVRVSKAEQNNNA
jgi:CBS domain containing-hemolysin-like protein